MAGVRGAAGAVCMVVSAASVGDLVAFPVLQTATATQGFRSVTFFCFLEQQPCLKAILHIWFFSRSVLSPVQPSPRCCMPMSWSYWPFHFREGACRLSAVTNSLLSSKGSWAERAVCALHRLPIQPIAGERGAPEHQRALFPGGAQRGVSAARPRDALGEHGDLLPPGASPWLGNGPARCSGGCCAVVTFLSGHGSGVVFRSSVGISRCFFMGGRTLEAADSQRVSLPVQSQKE